MIDTLLEVNIENENFLKIAETLSRIGIASKTEQTLYQSCHILFKKGKYYIIHFKELFALDGKETDFNDEDRARRNTIAFLLQDWGLLTIVNPEKYEDDQTVMNNIKIITFKEKPEWKLVQKYQLNTFKNENKNNVLPFSKKNDRNRTIRKN